MPTFDSPDPITVTVDVYIGDVVVSAGDRRDTTIDVRPSEPSNAGDRDAAEATRVEYANGKLLVRTPKQRSWNRGGAASVDITVEVHNALEPAGAPGADADKVEVRARTTIGDVVIRRP